MEARAVTWVMEMNFSMKLHRRFEDGMVICNELEANLVQW